MAFGPRIAMNRADGSASGRRHASTPAALSITTGLHDGTTVMALAGELDIATLGSLTAALARVGEPDMLVLDLRELEMIDSVGLRELLRADQRTRLEGRRMVLAVGEGQVRRVIHLTRLDRRLALVDRPEDALSL